MPRKPITLIGVILSVVVLFLVSAHCLAAEEKGHTIVNLVANPSFEESGPGDGEQPKGFVSGRVPGKDRAAKLTWEEPGHTGRKAVAVETMNSDDLGYWETVVSVKPSTEYMVSFYYKCRSLRAEKVTVGDPLYNKHRPGGPNLELGVVPGDESQMGKSTNWTDIGCALGPLGGTYLPATTEWAHYQQTVITLPGQTRMRLKLRVFRYAQKVWFDDLSVVELASVPESTIVSPSLDSIVNNGKPNFEWQGPAEVRTYLLEYSTSPNFNDGATKRIKAQGSRYDLRTKLDSGYWFWRVGISDQFGLPYWVAKSSFHAGGKAWNAADTTPPTVSNPSPLPNANAGPRPTIAAKFHDAGSGIDDSSVKIILDGKNVTAQATVGPEGLTLRPVEALAGGRHTVEILVSDKAGNLSNTLAWQFGVGETLKSIMKIAPKGILLNGKPFFPIGIYNYRCHPADGRFDEAALAAVSKAGYNFVLNTIETRSGLDTLFNNAIKGTLNISNDIKSCDTIDAAKVALMDKGQGRFRDHPSVLGLWADDPENADNTDGTPLPESTRVKLTNMREVLKTHIPDYPLLGAISNLPRLSTSVPFVDVIVAYRYPVPQYHPMDIYGMTMAYVNSVSQGKPVMFNSQAVDLGYGARFKSTEGSRPTPAEVRAMAFYSLVIGTNGFSLYANYINPKMADQWTELLRIGREMRHLAPVLAGGRDVSSVSLKKDSTHGSIFFREIEYNGLHTLIAVNLSGGRVMAHWQFEKPTRAIVLFEDRLMAEPAQEVPDLFEPFEVHLYQW